MKFYFTDNIGKKVFESKDLSEVEQLAKEYKEKKKLIALQIKRDRGQFFMWA